MLNPLPSRGSGAPFAAVTTQAVSSRSQCPLGTAKIAPVGNHCPKQLNFRGRTWICSDFATSHSSLCSVTSNPPRAGDSRVSKIRARLIISLEITKGLAFLACLTHTLSPGDFPQAEEGLPHSSLYPLSVPTSSSPLPFFIL